MDRKNYITRNIMYVIRIHRQVYSRDQIKKIEMGGTCITHRRNENCIQHFIRKSGMEEVGHVEGLGVDEMII
jgi:hypothetical protein